MNTHQKYDQNLLRLRQLRAINRFATGKDKSPDFLLDYVAEDFLTRLSTINRHFDNAVDLFGRTGKIAAALAKHPGVSKVTRLENPEFYTSDRIETETGISFSTADDLNLASSSTDLIVSAFALHWSPDLPKALARIKTALHPDGLFLGLLPGPGTLNELRQCFGEVESRLLGGISPRIDPFITIQAAGSLLQGAGFALPVVDTQTIIVRYDKAADLMRDLRAMGTTSVLAAHKNIRFSRKLFTEVSRHYAEHFSDEDGRIRASFELISLSGWAPDKSQQKPLKPGSASFRLVDALGKTAG
jgi:SAM-dependent methyltransferase